MIVLADFLQTEGGTQHKDSGDLVETFPQTHRSAYGCFQPPGCQENKYFMNVHRKFARWRVFSCALPGTSIRYASTKYSLREQAHCLYNTLGGQAA